MPTGIYKRKKEDINKLLKNSGNPKGNKLSKKVKRKISEAHKKIGSPWNIGNKWNVGRRRPINERKKISETLKKIGHKPPYVTGKNHHNWKGGLSNNPYPKKFNYELKRKIRERDNFICCLCGKTERQELEELNRVLCVNHIDFNKNNCEEKNLNTLCLGCNIKINREREYWTNYFNQNI